MSTFGLKVLIRVLVPYSFGIFFSYMGIKGIINATGNKTGNIFYCICGIILALGAIIHLLFVSYINMYM